MRCASSLLLLLGSTGCSLAFVKGPPPPARRQGDFACTESWAAPVVDLLATAVGVRGILVADDDFFSSRSEKTAVSGVWSAAFAASAIVGFKRVRDCRAAKRARARIPVANGRTSFPDNRPSLPTLSPLRAPCGHSLDSCGKEELRVDR